VRGEREEERAMDARERRGAGKLVRGRVWPIHSRKLPLVTPTDLMDFVILRADWVWDTTMRRTIYFYIPILDA
jgi:hypothetical protein